MQDKKTEEEKKDKKKDKGEKEKDKVLFLRYKLII